MIGGVTRHAPRATRHIRYLLVFHMSLITIKAEDIAADDKKETQHDPFPKSIPRTCATRKSHNGERISRRDAMLSASTDSSQKERSRNEMSAAVNSKYPLSGLRRATLFNGISLKRSCPNVSVTKIDSDPE